MKKRIITLIQGLFEYLLFFPLVLMFGIFIVPEKLWIWIAVLIGLFIVGVLFRLIFSQQKWWVYAICSIVFSIIPTILFGHYILSLILLSFIHPIVIYRGMMYVGRNWESLLPTSFMWYGGFGIYFVGYILFRYVEKFQSYLTIISICGAAVVVIILFISNSEQLKASTLSKDKKPFISRAIKTQNRVYLILTAAVIFLLTNGKVVQEAVLQAFKGFIQLILWLVGSDQGGKAVEETPPPNQMELGLEKGEPNAFLKFLEMIFMYVFYAVIVVLAVGILLLFIKRVRMLVKKYLSKFIAFLKNIIFRSSELEEAGQYIDEKESVFDWKEWKDAQKDKAKGLFQQIFKREPRWDSLTNEQKVRYVYKQMLKQNKKEIEYKASKTPRETIELLKTLVTENTSLEELRDAYEQVRYGKKNVEDSKIKNLRLLIKE
ncbi:DUF4129 domain-containing protein [Lederbergia wuyishanensis]|uniref:DUF4129 domain-containing protein n=1 Tax=Lederbergia wuyishanensis TaxID=1347903 RepID=A0ABU0D965_9BACI|nr:DUF4129 domain-containing protein [Lederbergia wuyishanensis]MCJ8007530.1 DUF4129 domain-containing protein [Lederbergia wuyishanensis]MDQ0344890.1 hypothetical protein [Lederbergia wuyishanensis]